MEKNAQKTMSWGKYSSENKSTRRDYKKELVTDKKIVTRRKAKYSKKINEKFLFSMYLFARNHTELISQVSNKNLYKK